MNSDCENNNMTATSLEALIQANGQSMEVREQVPYQPVVYAIPEEWLQAEKVMLEQAVKFQPTLYRMIGTLATKEEMERAYQIHLTQLIRQNEDTMKAVRNTLQQDGNMREKYSSELSKMLSDSLRAMETVASNLQKKITKILIATAVSSAALSVLACLALQHLAG